MKKQLLFLFAFCLAAAVNARAQVAQPAISSITPLGAKRGTTTIFTVEGLNLGGASEVLWSQPGITARITLNSELAREKTVRANQFVALILDKATKNRVTIEAGIAPDAPAGIYSFRIKTAFGTTDLGRIAVTGLPETPEREMSAKDSDAQEITLPTTVVGELSQVGEADHYKFKARAGQQIVCSVAAAALGSRLDSVLTLLDSQGQALASNNDFGRGRDSLLGYTFKESGEYVIRISDRERQGRRGQFRYRLNIGELPYVTGVFPLGLRQGATSEIVLTGFNLGVERVKVAAPFSMKAGARWGETMALKLGAAPGAAPGNVRLAVGRYPEIIESETASTLARPQAVSLPVTINGRIWDRGTEGQGDRGTGGRREGTMQISPSLRLSVHPSPYPSVSPSPRPSVEDFYRFTARKGQRLVLEVEAQRLGSPLDAVIEVFDAQGRPVPRATLRCLLETSLTLIDHDSMKRGLRLVSVNGIEPNDYMLVGSELLQVDSLPGHPDADTIFKGIAGQRIGFEDTTPEAHAINTPVYKVSVHPPGASLPSNGLPVVTLYYRNDDGGPGFGKDSRLNFTAPADGDYIVRVSDVRGCSGEQLAYRLTLREPAPDFLLSIAPDNVNAPPGGQAPITVEALRVDGWSGEIEVKLLDLPAGFGATTGLIRADQNTTVILLEAASDAQGRFPLRIQGSARANGQSLVREAKTEELMGFIAVGPPPELIVSTDLERALIEPGGQATLTIKVARQRGFAGRVPIEVKNLPPGIIVKDVGLNGILITEAETTTKILLDAQPWVRPTEQPIFIVGRIETTSPQRSEFPAPMVTLAVQLKWPKRSAAAQQIDRR